MHRTVKELKEWAAEVLHEDFTDTVLDTILFPRWVNQVVSKIVSHKVWKWNEDQMRLQWPRAAGTTQDASVLYLPHFIDRILTLYPGSNAGIRSVKLIDAWELDQWRPGIGALARRDYLAQYGWYGVQADNPALATLNVRSTGGTVGTQNVLLEGLTNDNFEIREVVPVLFNTVVATTSIFKAGVGGLRRVKLVGDNAGDPITTTGIMTVENGATILERLDSATERAHEHRRTELYAAATGTTSYTARYYRRHYPVLVNRDIVDLPFEFSDVLELGLAERLAFFRKQFDEQQACRSYFEVRLREMRAWDNREPGKKRNFSVAPQWGGYRRGLSS